MISRTRRWISHWSALVLLALYLPMQVGAQENSASVEVFPIQAAAGMSLRLIAHDLQPSRSYGLILTPSAGTSSTSLGTANSDANGAVNMAIALPVGLSPGTYELRVQGGTGPAPLVQASTDFTVLGNMSVFVLSALNPRPGYRVSVRVNGLVPGTLEFIYADGSVYGPVPVTDSQVVFGLTLPEDRPASLPAAVPYRAINRVGRVMINEKIGTISVAPRSSTPIQLSLVSAPTVTSPQTPVALSARLTREDGIKPGTEVDAYWFGADGSVIPMPGNATSFDAQGNFAINTLAPSLLSMSAGLAEGSGQIRFMTRETPIYGGHDDIVYAANSGSGGLATSGPQAMQTGSANAQTNSEQVRADGLLTFFVRGTNNQPVANAVVELAPADTSPYTQTFLTNLNGGGESGRNTRNIVAMGISQHSFVRAGRADIVGIGAAPFITPDCPPVLRRQETDAQGRVQFQLDLAAISEMTGDITCGSPSGPNDAGNCRPTQAIFFKVTVYGGQSGFGHRNPTTEAYLPATYELVYYADRDWANSNVDDLMFQLTAHEPIFDYSESGVKTLTPTFTTRLPTLNVPAVVVENVRMQGLIRESAPPTGGGLPAGSNAAAWFAPILTFPVASQAAFVSANPTYKMYFNHSPLVGGVLTNASMWFDFNNNGSLDLVGNFVFDNNQTGQCGLTNLDAYELPFSSMTSSLASVFRYGLNNIADQRVERCGEIRATNQAGATSKRQVCFQFAPLLNYGIINGDTTELIINDDLLGHITYSGNQNNLLPSGSRDLDVPPISGEDGDGGLAERNQQNRVNNSVGVGGVFNSVGGAYSDPLLGAQTPAEKLNYLGFTRSELVSRSSANRQNSRDGESQSATQSLSAASTTTGSLDPVTVLDVSFPLFYYVWGISPIAGLEMGADMSLLAQFIAKTTLRSNENNSLEVVNALTRQIVDISIDFYADLDVLFDLVDGEFTLSPILCAGVEIRKVGNSPNVKELARVSLVMDYLISIWTPPPFPNIESEDRVPLASEGDVTCQGIDGHLIEADKGAVASPAHPERYGLAIASDIPTAIDTNRYLGFFAYEEPILNPGASDLGKTSLMVKRPGQDAIEITRAYGIRQLDLEYYQANRAVLVWVQSADPPPSPVAGGIAQVTQIVARQHLRYSRWNGTSWSAPANLTPPGNGGEGGLTLAGCHTFQNNCGTGKVLAVWTRSTSGNFRDLRTRVYQSEFTPASGGSWSTPTVIDASGVNDSHATAVYKSGTAVVAWLRNSAGTVASAKTRSLAYRLMDGIAPVRIAGSVPLGVSWPKLAVDRNNRIGMAFAVPEDGQSFLGNRQAVHVSELSCNATGTCAFNVLKVKDRRGRSVLAEHPIPVWDYEGNFFVGYRGVSYGADSAGTTRNYAEDPPGIRFKTGEVMKFSTNLTGVDVNPVALTADGGGYASMDMALDGATGTIATFALRNSAIARRADARAKTFNIEATKAGASAHLISENIVQLDRMLGPDIAIGDVSVSQSALIPNSTRSVRVEIGNRGTAFVTNPTALFVLGAYWDNPAPMQGLAVSKTLTSLASGETQTVTLNVPIPAHFVADEQHVLYLRLLSTNRNLVDVDASNNQIAVAIGGMPIPQSLISATQPNLPLVRLEWDAITAPTVKGYRIYRQDDGGPVVPLGSSPVAAFVDISAQFDETRTYYVSSYSARGVESAMSEALPVMAIKLSVDGLFRDGFEAVAPQ